MINWNVDFGNILTISGMAIAATSVVLTMRGRLDRMEADLSKLADATTKMAVQSQRLDNHENNLVLQAERVLRNERDISSLAARVAKIEG